MRSQYLVLGLFVLILGGMAAAQVPPDKSKRPSPPGMAEVTLAGQKMVIDYSRPSLRGRTLESLAPSGQVWRTGANEATALFLEADRQIGGITVPAGHYTLYTLPSAGPWKLIINKQTGQWGTVYKPDLDLARVDMHTTRLLQPVEQFTILFRQRNAETAELVLQWETTEVSVPVRVK
jgi:hypothetical protein